MSNRTAEADCAEQTMSPPAGTVLAGTALAGTVLAEAALAGGLAPAARARPARRGEMVAGLVSHEIAQRMYTRRA